MSKKELAKMFVGLWRDYENYCKAIHADDGQPDWQGFMMWLDYSV